MKIVKVKSEFFTLCKKYNTYNEIMFNKGGRPCVLLVNLKYKGKIHKFVVPLRSNISGSTPSDQYLSLPPNSETKSGRSHGVHYIKLFPITSKYIEKYNMNDSFYKKAIINILNNKEKLIIEECQNYLNRYELGEGNKLTPDIDGILNWIYT